MKILTAVLSGCLIVLMAQMVAPLAPAPASPLERGRVCHCPRIPAPKPCGRDEDCPQYFVETCGYDRNTGQIMVFSGDCYMENYNCRTNSNFEAVDLTYCKPVPVSSGDWYR